jgi:hypothetical protein
MGMSFKLSPLAQFVLVPFPLLSEKLHVTSEPVQEILEEEPQLFWLCTQACSHLRPPTGALGTDSACKEDGAVPPTGALRRWACIEVYESVNRGLPGGLRDLETAQKGKYSKREIPSYF